MDWTPEEWAKKLQEVPIRRIDKAEWPKGMRPISLDEEGLGVDKDGGLYWQLKPVMIKRRIELRWFELLLLFIVAAATAAQWTCPGFVEWCDVGIMRC